ncbi:MAG: hypothetical protein JXA20_15455 [Spirochaetes bacterium]|nr:hypothetical protein [Spirochaetota bacterium]
MATAPSSAASRTVRFIYTAEGLGAINDDPGTSYDDYYILLADLDLTPYASGEGWEPIGTAAAKFTGTFDGNGHVIRNLRIDRAADTSQGLFGTTCNALIKDLGLEGVDVSVTVTSKLYVGALAGDMQSSSAAKLTLTRCYVTGSVSGNQYVGGLLGNGEGTIKHCHSAAEVSAGDAVEIGRFAARINKSNLSECYNLGPVTVTGTCLRVAGFAARVAGTSILNNCYQKGAVTFPNGEAVGFVDTIESGSSMYYGFVTGLLSGKYQRGFVSSGENGGGIYGQSTGISTGGYTMEQMKTAKTYTDKGWDFTTVWDISPDINEGYPHLRNYVP